MKRATKIWLIAAVTMLLLGACIFVGCMTALKWDFVALSTEEFETNEHEIAEGFENIRIVTSTADVAFALSDNEACKVVCYEDAKQKHEVSVRNGTLEVCVRDERKWYDYIEVFQFSQPKLTVYLPATAYASLSLEASTGDVTLAEDFGFESIVISVSTGDVSCFASASETASIKTTTGSICVENASVGSLELAVSTGRVTVTEVVCENDVSITVSTGKACLKKVSCENLASSGDTGAIFLEDVIALQKISIERSTGDVAFDGCDAAELLIETDTGDVKGSLLSEKVFIVTTDTGKVDVPKTLSGGKCEIITDTGDIEIEIKK